MPYTHLSREKRYEYVEKGGYPLTFVDAIIENEKYRQRQLLNHVQYGDLQSQEKFSNAVNEMEQDTLAVSLHIVLPSPNLKHTFEQNFSCLYITAHFGCAQEMKKAATRGKAFHAHSQPLFSPFGQQYCSRLPQPLSVASPARGATANLWRPSKRSSRRSTKPTPRSSGHGMRATVFSLVFIIRPVAPLLAICRLGCLAASVNTAKHFEANVAPMFRACEKTQQQAHLHLVESLCKTCATENKE